MKLLFCLALATPLFLPAASFVTAASCSINPGNGSIIVATGITSCSLTSPVVGASVILETYATATVFGNSVIQTANSIRITEQSMAGAAPFGQASSIDLVSLAIDVAGPPRYGYLQTLTVNGADQDCEGCGPGITLTVNGVTPIFGIHPPPIQVWFGSTIVIRAAITNRVAGSGFEPGSGSATIDSTFTFFESDLSTPANITVSEAPEPSIVVMFLAGLAVLAGRFLFQPSTED